jgi:hypothetical protein
MSTTGQMGAVESFDWTLADGRVMRVTVDRGLLATYLTRRILSPGKGGKRRERVTMAWGGVKAKWVTP